MSNPYKSVYNVVGDFFSSFPSRAMQTLFGESNEKSNFEVRAFDLLDSKSSRQELTKDYNFPIENTAKTEGQPLRFDNRYTVSFKQLGNERKVSTKEVGHNSDGILSGSRLKTSSYYIFIAL